MNKIIAGLFIILFISSGYVLAATSLSNCPQDKTTNALQTMSTSIEELYPVMSNPIPIKIPSESDQASTITIIDTPSEFSWKNYNGIDLTTNAKNQGQCGSCWAFGALGAIETLINIKEGYKDIDIDLSEQYLLSCLPEAGSCNGGRTASPFSFIINTSEEGNFVNGVIFEECLPYEADDDVPCSTKADYWMDTLVPLSDWGEIWFGPNNNEAIEIMKSKIFQNGPIYSLMLVDDSFRYFGSIFHRSTDYFPYRSLGVDMLNHAILVVGWKDDPNISKGGYWICKNSWDTDWGYDGFFNIEYGSLNIHYYMAWPEYDATSFDCPPKADANGFYIGNVDEELMFDGSHSFDAEDENLHYLWDFGDGTIGESMVMQHEFTESGIYDIKLTVTDQKNHTSTDTTIAFIDQETLNFDFSGGYGITIDIINHLEYDLLYTQLSIDVSGLIQNMDYRNEDIIGISAHDTFTMTLPILGLGKGTMHLTYENIEITKQFIAIGPFAIIN
jgi:C1A family cysteine protease